MIKKQRKINAQKRFEAIEQALLDGHPGPGIAGNNIKAAPRIAAERLEIDRRILDPNGIQAIEKIVGKKIDWTLSTYKPVVEPVIDGTIESALKTEKLRVPKNQDVRRYILTCAQNNTHLHHGLWLNLLALRDHYNAQLIVSRITYNLNAYSAQPVKSTQDSDPRIWYDKAILDYIVDHVVELAPGLEFRGEMNILPTATDPLSQLEAYSGRSSSIFPHTKFAMKSVASGKNEPTKFVYTTGTVTTRNYLARKAGLKAEPHHGYGAVIVEVDKAGNWYVRQLQARDRDGTFCDLNLRVEGGKVYEDQTVEAIHWGDIHERFLKDDIRELCWGDNGMLNELVPKYQFMEDIIHFLARNHHDVKSGHKRFKRHTTNTESVGDEIESAVQFLHGAKRSWCQTIVVDSNHDRALTRWLDEGTWKTDPINAIFYLEANLEFLKGIENGEDFHVLEWACRNYGAPLETTFLRQDESFILTRDEGGGIEQGLHGDEGPNGSRGTPIGFKRLGRKVNIGDKHMAEITEGVFVAGVTGSLDQEYNTGPSSWSHSHIVTYPIGTRTIVTMWNGKYKG